LLHQQIADATYEPSDSPTLTPISSVKNMGIKPTISDNITRAVHQAAEHIAPDRVVPNGTTDARMDWPNLTRFGGEATAPLPRRARDCAGAIRGQNNATTIKSSK